MRSVELHGQKLPGDTDGSASPFDDSATAGWDAGGTAAHDPTPPSTLQPGSAGSSQQDSGPVANLSPNLSPGWEGSSGGPEGQPAGDPLYGDLQSGSKGTVQQTGGTSTVISSSLPAMPASPTPFTININWDASVANAPSGFTSDIIAAAQYLETQFVNAATIAINVGYGSIAGGALSGGALGESMTYLASVSYSTLAGAIKSDGLPSSNPIGGANYWLTSAQAKGLGLPGGNSLDGYVGFATSSAFTYGDTATTGTVAPGTYDFFATALHEMTEVMGRQMLVGQTVGSSTSSYTLLDLLHFSAPGVRDLVQSTPGYLSLDDGVTNLGAFNTSSGGDAGDWASSVANDPFDAFASGGLEVMSANDLTEIGALGWSAAGTVVVPPPPPPSQPTGISIAAMATSLSNALTVASPVAALKQIGGAAGDTYTYTLGGPGASAFGLTTSGNVGTLMSGASGLVGSTSGLLYALNVTATDVTSGLSSPAVAVDVIAGTSGVDTIAVQTVSANLGKSTPTFIFGQGSGDTLNGSGMTGNQWFVGGGGADKMTGGSGVNDYIYGATGDSIASAMDVITNFHPAVDLIDLTALGTSLQVAGSISSKGKGPSVNSLGAHSIGWQSNGKDTYVYVNTSGATENISAANMKIDLTGAISLSSGNFLHT
jgi:hypothetical protein